MQLLVLQTKIPCYKSTSHKLEKKKLTVDELCRVMYDPLDKSFLLKVTDSDTGQATTNFETFNKNTLADEFEGGDFFEDSVVGGLVKRDGMLSLVLNLSLRPLLLLCRFSTCRWGCFCFGLEQ